MKKTVEILHLDGSKPLPQPSLLLRVWSWFIEFFRGPRGETGKPGRDGMNGLPGPRGFTTYVSPTKETLVEVANEIMKSWERAGICQPVSNARTVTATDSRLDQGSPEWPTKPGCQGELCVSNRSATDSTTLVETGEPPYRSRRAELRKKSPGTPRMTLPLDSAARKEVPLLRGCLRYFPAALAGVATISKRGNDKHNPGEPLHHARGKSTDHGDCIVRHLVDVQDLLAAKAPADQILYEVDQLAWRALAYSQELHESAGGSPLAPGAKLAK